tara:strand:- start:108710 stop:108877 length:168 start_codon:yes stop_codon:yes gene_type:complete
MACRPIERDGDGMTPIDTGLACRSNILDRRRDRRWSGLFPVALRRYQAQSFSAGK